MKKNRTMKVIFNVGALAVLAALGISAYQLGTSQNGEIIQEILPMESVQKSDAKEDEIKEEASAQADTRLVQAETGSGSITAGENLIQERDTDRSYQNCFVCRSSCKNRRRWNYRTKHGTGDPFFRRYINGVAGKWKYPD